jgi:hypothetical protein
VTEVSRTSRSTQHSRAALVKRGDPHQKRGKRDFTTRSSRSGKVAV